MIKRNEVIQIFIEKLTQLRVVNGYTCDIGQHVEYFEGIKKEPIADCVAVMDGRENFGAHVRRGVWIRTLDLSICAAFVENKPQQRAGAAAEDLLKWLDANPSMGVPNLKIELVAMSTGLDGLGELAELVCELKVTY